MNRILKSILVVLAATAGSAFAAETDSTTVAVTGNIGNSIAISDPSTAAITLAAGTTSTVPVNFTVDATGGFTVRAESNMSRMTEYDTSTSAYVTGTPKTIAGQPTISAVGVLSDNTTTFGSAASTVDLAPDDDNTDGSLLGATIFTSTSAVSAGTVKSTISQPVTYSDVQLTGTKVYRIEVTYTAALTL